MEVIDNKTVVEETQEAKIARLENQLRVTEIEKEAIKSEAKRQISALTPGGTDAQVFLAERQKEKDADSALRQQFDIYFGKNSSAAASKLYKDDPATYHRIKALGQSKGWIPDPNFKVARGVFTEKD